MLCLLCVAGTSVPSELTREKFPFYEWRSGNTSGAFGHGREGRAGVRLCNLAAPGWFSAEGSIQAGSGDGTDGRESEPWEIIHCKPCKTQIPNVRVSSWLPSYTDDSRNRYSGAMAGSARLRNQVKPRSSPPFAARVEMIPSVRDGLLLVRVDRAQYRWPSRSLIATWRCPLGPASH
jgi:hypothetical protein